MTIIRDGATVESGTLDELRHLTRVSIDAVVTGDPAAVTGSDGVHDVRVDPVPEGHRVRFDVESARLGEVVPALGGLGVRSLTSQPPTLEELFLRHYGDEPEDGAPAEDGGDGTPSPS